MSSPLSQDLAGKIIEVLTQRGHVLLSRGGKSGLVRELSDRMNDALALIVGRMPPPGIVDNEVTSTFGDEKVDDAVEEMVEEITASLMDSDQVEDIFSEDAVIRRDVFRVVKDTLLSAERAWGEGEEADVEVALASLGYVAAKAAERAGASLVEAALGRAGKASGARLVKFSPEAQTATFRAALGTPDARLELEEAVADELSSLVDEGKVALPTIERRVPLGRALSPEERRASRTRIDIAATRTLLRSGCTATWEFAGGDAIAVSLVPMSEQDGRAVDAHVEAFAREVAGIVGRPRPEEEPAAAGLDAWIRLARETGKPPAREPRPSASRAAEAPPASKRAAREQTVSNGASKEAPPSAKKPAKAPERAPASRKEAAPPTAKAPAKKAPAAKKEPAAKKPAAAKKEPAAKKPAAAKKAAAKKEPAKKPAAKKAAAAKKPASKSKPAGRAAAKKPASKSKPAPRRAKVSRPASKPSRTPKKPSRTAPKPSRTPKKPSRTPKKVARTATKPSRTPKKVARTAAKPSRTPKKARRAR